MDKLTSRMATATATPPPEVPRVEGPAGFERALGHPLAFVGTAIILLALFGSTFIFNPGRTAPTRDPAFYTWRTEALLTEEPVRLIEIEGPNGLHGGAYRISAPVIGGLLRRIGNVDSRSTVAFLMVITPVIVSLLLAGFAYRHRRDPVLWHAVAFTSAGLMLTPPFVGYLDNVMSMLFLAGALWFVGPARTSWPGRVGFGIFLLATGVTHTTTLAIFGLTLGAMTAARILFGRSDSGLLGRARAVVQQDAPMLGTALGAAILTVGIWTIGLWGSSAPLSESALVFPYSKDFFMARLDEWVDAMRPVLNGPLFALGALGLLAAGRRWVDDDLALVPVVWTAPLVGTFGFLLDLVYPYYRFFNTTLAWVLLVGIGAYFAVRFFIEKARPGGVSRLALVGVLGVVFILATNFTAGFDASHWNDPSRGWLTPKKRSDLDLLRANLAELAEVDRPVVFVMDVRPPEIQTLAQVWGITQVNGNTARYGLPPGQIDQSYVYQGALESYLAGQPTTTENAAYDDLAAASLEDLREGIAESEGEPLVVLASVFNENGPNASIAAGEVPPPDVPGNVDLWILNEGTITAVGETTPPFDTAVRPLGVPEVTGDAGLTHVAWLLIACALLLAPGVLIARWLVPDGGVAEYLGIAPATAVALLVLVGTAVLAVARGPLSTTLAWITLGLSVAAGAALLLRAGIRPSDRSGATR
jgi:hypothetical protein